MSSRTKLHIVLARPKGKHRCAFRKRKATQRREASATFVCCDQAVRRRSRGPHKTAYTKVEVRELLPGHSKPPCPLLRSWFVCQCGRAGLLVDFSLPARRSCRRRGSGACCRLGCGGCVPSTVLLAHAQTGESRKVPRTRFGKYVPRIAHHQSDPSCTQP
jgi:hypothetical protein